MPTSVWAPDTTIKTAEVNPETQHPTAWEADTGLYRARLGGYCDGAPRTEITCGNASLVWETARLSWLIYDEGAAQPRWQTAAAVPTCDGQAETVTEEDHDRITIRGAYSGAGADEYLVFGNALKHSVILQSVAVPDGATELALDGYLTLTGCAPGYASGRTAGDLYLFPLVDGVPDTSAAPVLTLLRGQVSDSADNVTHTVYEWRTEEDGRISLALLVDAEWLRDATPGEITIDPTVQVATLSGVPVMPSNSRPMAYLLDETLFSAIPDGTNLVARYLAPGDTDWSTPSAGATIWSGAGGASFRGASVAVVGSIIYVFASNGTNPRLYRGVWSSGSIAWTYTAITLSYNSWVDVVAAARTDGRNQIAVAYGYNGGSGGSVGVRQVTDDAGTMTVGAALSSAVEPLGSGDPGVAFVLRANGSLVLASVGSRFSWNAATWDGLQWTWGATTNQNVTNISANSGGVSLVSTTDGDFAAVRLSTGVTSVYKLSPWTNLSYPADSTGAIPGVISADHYGNLYVYTNVGGTLVRRKYSSSWGSAVTVRTATIQRITTGRGGDNANIDALWVEGTSPYTIQHDRFVSNAPPQEPTITAPTSFHTPTGLTLTVTQNDTSGDSMTGLYLRAVGSDSTDRYWDGSAWQTAEPATPITASGASWTATITTGWTAGVTYQLYTATVDAGGLKGPYNATAVVTKASTKPVYTGTSPGASITSGRIQVRGTMTCGSGATPASYVVRILAADGTTVLYGPVTVNSSGALAYDPPYDHTNGLTYYWGVTPTDSDGLAGDETTDDYAASFTPPATPTGVFVPMSDAFPPHVSGQATSPEPTGSQPTVTAYRYERSTDKVTVTDMGTLAPGVEFQDTCGKSGQVYYYRSVAIGDNGTEAASPWYSAGVDRDCDWFIPVDYPELAIPFAFNRESSLGDARQFAAVKPQGRFPVTTSRAQPAYEGTITATFPDYLHATPHEGVQLTRDGWLERFDTVATKYQGYWVTADGMVKRGILAPVSNVQRVRDMVINPYVITCRFIEKATVG